MIDCTTCKHWRWDTGTTFGGWCAKGHKLRKPTGQGRWMREDCADYVKRNGRPVAKAKPNLTLFEGGQNE